MAITYHKTTDKDEAVNKATELLTHVLTQEIEKQTPVLLLLSGGSALEILKELKIDTTNSDITIAPLDERYSTDSAENNMAQIMASSFYSAVKDSVASIDTRVQLGETQEQLASRFNSALVEWLAEHPQGKIVATVGMGTDGHISGMMPYPESPELFLELFDTNDKTHLVQAYDAGGKNPYALRVTTTMILMRQIDTAIAFIVGENKQKPLANVQAKEGDLATTPARVLSEMADVQLVTDIN